MKNVVACASLLFVLIAFSAMSMPVNKAAPHKYSHEIKSKSADAHQTITPGPAMDPLVITAVTAICEASISFEKPFVGYVLLKPQALNAKVLNKHISTVAHSPPKLE
jgi:hypothetical protein